MRQNGTGQGETGWDGVGWNGMSWDGRNPSGILTDLKHGFIPGTDLSTDS